MGEYQFPLSPIRSSPFKRVVIDRPKPRSYEDVELFRLRRKIRLEKLKYYLIAAEVEMTEASIALESQKVAKIKSDLRKQLGDQLELVQIQSRRQIEALEMECKCREEEALQIESEADSLGQQELSALHEMAVQEESNEWNRLQQEYTRLTNTIEEMSLPKPEIPPPPKQKSRIQLQSPKKKKPKIIKTSVM